MSVGTVLNDTFGSERCVNRNRPQRHTLTSPWPHLGPPFLTIWPLLRDLILQPTCNNEASWLQVRCYLSFISQCPDLLPPTRTMIPASFSFLIVRWSVLVDKRRFCAISFCVKFGFAFSSSRSITAIPPFMPPVWRFGGITSLDIVPCRAVNLTVKSSPSTEYSGSGVPDNRQASMIFCIPRPQASIYTVQF